MAHCNSKWISHLNRLAINDMICGRILHCNTRTPLQYPHPIQNLDVPFAPPCIVIPQQSVRLQYTPSVRRSGGPDDRERLLAGQLSKSQGTRQLRCFFPAGADFFLGLARAVHFFFPRVACMRVQAILTKKSPLSPFPRARGSGW